MRYAILALALLANPAPADPRIAGTYEGIIQSTGVDLPGTTKLIVSQTGEISGSYLHQDGDSRVLVELKFCDFYGSILSCAWNGSLSSYGHGTLFVAFSPDLRAFRGGWYDCSIGPPADSPDGGVLWTGTRADD